MDAGDISQNFLGGLFIFCLLSFYLYESISPKREKSRRFSERTLANISIFLLSLLFVTFCKVVLITVFSEKIVNMPSINITALPILLQFLIAVFLLEGINYYFHRLSHSVNFLWRFHKVHHSDKVLDIFTYFRHHPIEVLFSSFVILFFVELFSLPIIMVSIYLVLNNIFQVFQHSNIRIPHLATSFLNRYFITPDLHAEHHLKDRKRSDTNYGTILTIFDKVHKTYALPGSKNEYGIAENEYFGERIDGLLLMPFRK